MNSATERPLRLDADVEEWPLAEVIRIAGRTFSSSTVVHVRVSAGGLAGHGEGSGVYYKGDDAANMLRGIESVRSRIEAGLSRVDLQALLPPGGARNALDCALWDLEARLTGVPVWQRAGLAEPRALTTTFTVSAETPQAMARRATTFPSPRAVKLKLLGDGQDAQRVRAVREALPEVWLGVDANQAFTPHTLEALLPTLVEATPFQKANLRQLVERYYPMLIRFGPAGDRFVIVPKRAAIAEAQAEGAVLWEMKKSAAREAWREIEPGLAHICDIVTGKVELEREGAGDDTQTR